MMPGTDTRATLIFPGFDLHEELKLFVEKTGLTPAEALRSATLIPAEYAGLSSSLGTIEKDRIADLVMLDADPLADITNTKRIAAVFAGGQYLSHQKLKEMLKNVEKTLRAE